MIDTTHPVVRRLVERGFDLSLHAYLRDGRVKTTVAAKNPKTGELLQGWSQGGPEKPCWTLHGGLIWTGVSRVREDLVFDGPYE